MNDQLHPEPNDRRDVLIGRIIDGEATVEELGREIFDQLLEHASGRLRTKSELSGMGNDEFMPWPIGIVC